MKNINIKRVMAIVLTLSGLPIAYTAFNNTQPNSGAETAVPDFTLLNNQGQPIAVKNNAPVIPPACIRDNVTQLTWDAGNTNNANQNQILHYATQLNAVRWCGFADWRLPNQTELRDLADTDSANYFSHPAAVRAVRGDVYTWGEKTWQLKSGRVVRANGALADTLPHPAATIKKYALNEKGVGVWSLAGSMSVTRNDHTATRLPNGQVLIVGGFNDATAGYLDSAELYNPSTNAWSNVSAMANARQYHTATLLNTGKVLVVGGYNEADGWLDSAELYTPSTGTWTSAGTMPNPSAGHTATLLVNGKVLIAGGFNNGTFFNTTALYDPSTSTWNATGAMPAASSDHTATLLTTNKVLVAGGCNSTICGLKNAHLYDPTAGTWTSTAPMGALRSYHAAVLLTDGTVLVSGGYDEAAQHSTHLASAERYNPTTGTWSATGSMLTESQNHSLTLLPNDQVLAAAGETNSAFGSTRAELYDPVAGTWNTTVSLSLSHDTHTATFLNNFFQVLVTGGSGSADAELYDSGEAAVIVAPPAGLITTEAAGTATFTVKLATQPTATVTINLTSSDTTEGTVAPTTLTFTTANWDTNQTVTITGVNDVIDDNNQPYFIDLATTITSGDYTGVNIIPVAVTNIDNDTRAILITPTSGLTTTEATGTGHTATFTVKLATQPTASVTIGLTSSDTTEGTVAPASLIFTTSTWNTAQTVTITGVDDSIDDNNVNYSIATAAATGGDYAGINGADVAVTNIDNDIRGITVTPTTGLTTTEAGGTATFTVTLNTLPTANVTIGLTSSDLTEGTVAPARLTFTTSNWNTAQTVTVTGVNDTLQDGNIAYSIVTAPAVGGDYAGVNPTDVAVTNTDNDSRGFTIIPTTGLVTTEAGGTATFTVKLNTLPTAIVTLGLTSSDTTEGTVAPASLTFTPTSWDTAQTVTVTGVSDNLTDGNIAYSITTAAAVSTDTGYNGINPVNVAVTNIDGNASSIIVTVAATPLVTTEATTTLTKTFTIKLATEPTANVIIGLTSSDTTEGTVSPTSLLFTIANYNIAQTVTVTRVDDLINDGNINYSIITAPVPTTPVSNYAGLNAVDVAMQNTDNDARGVTIVPTTTTTSRIVTTEAGGITTFTLKLNSEPTADVTIGLSSSNINEGTVAPASLTFSPVNWSIPQTVTVTGVDDTVVDGTIAYSIVTAVAIGGDYGTANFKATDVYVNNTDNDSRGFTVTPNIVSPNTGLITTEAGGTATFTVQLNTAPTANVVIGLSSSNIDEGTINKTSLTFTAANWNNAQTVTITGIDDSVDDGNIAYSIVTAPATSTDTGYNGINAADVAVTNTDDDTRGITVSPVATTPATSLTTTEAGGTTTFTVKLNSEPTANVTIPLSSSGIAEGTVSPTSLIFTPANWNTAQTVTVTGVDDFVDDGNVLYTIVTAPAIGGDYTNIDAANVLVRNIDNDTRGITVSAISSNTSEIGGAATFTISLITKPTADVTIGLTSADLTEGTITPASLTFTAANWNTAQTVTVTGVDDNLDDGDMTYSIVTAAVTGTSDYVGINPADVTVINVDNDTNGIIVTPTTGLTTTEAGGTATFTVTLSTQPTANVTIGLSSSDLTEGTVSPASLTFTPGNAGSVVDGVWVGTPQTVTVKGVDDYMDDGDMAYSIITAAPVGGNYTGVDTANVAVTNIDNDTRGVTVTPTSGLITTEAGGTATFTIKLNAQPTSNVKIGLSSSDLTEGTVFPASVTFNTTNWFSVQRVTVTGVDDSMKDGNVVYTITTAKSVGGDYGTAGIDAPNVSVTNLDDNDTIEVTANSGLTTTEAGGTATFTVKLSAAPTASVTIGLSSSDTTEGTVSPSSLTFTTSDWSAKTVTVTGQPDDLIDGQISYKIQFNNAIINDVTITNIDIDGINLTPITGLVTTEGAGTATFTVELGTQPTANVNLALSSSDLTEGTISPASLTFTSSDWSTAQTVTVTGVNDDVDDGDITYSIKTANATSDDSRYKNYNALDVTVTNTDDDTRGITVTPTSGLVTTEALGTATFTVKLDTQPTASVGIGLSSSDTTEGTVSVASLTFTTANWATAQTVTVTGVNDNIDDGDIAYTITTAAATGGDYGTASVNAADVTVTNTDNDTSAIASTNAAASITATGATLNGLVTPGTASTTVTFEYGLTTSYGSTIAATPSPIAANAVATAVTASVTTFTCGTTYHYRVKAVNSVGTSYGTDISFTTTACPVSSAATVITATGATLNGTVTPGAAATTVTFDYGTTTSYGSTVTATQSPVAANAAATAVTASVTTFTCGTTYHYRVKAVNSGGTSYGADISFTTTACPVTVAATPIAATTATLKGTVTPGAAATTVTFDYGLTTSYGSTATATQSPIAANAAATSVSIAITGLTTKKTYNYRVKTVNTGGTAYGANMTFTTP